MPAPSSTANTLASDDPRAAVVSRLLLESGTSSMQVLNEVVSVARRKLKLSWIKVSEALATFCVLCAPPQSLTLATHEATLALAERDQFSFYDALIVVSALEACCTTRLSEDLHDRQGIAERLTVKNPFRSTHDHG